MNIALVTNKELHHKYWISQLYKSNNIELIIHPTGLSESFIKRIRKKKLFYYGIFVFFLKTLSIIYSVVSRNGMNLSINAAEKKYFKKYEKEYLKIPKETIVDVETVNSQAVIDLIKKHKIDIICFLGGDIAKKEFINSAKLCLNYHSGVSPFYNGTKTNFHTVSDFRPNFTGGTLMKMNERIDGGEILMHYICPIVNDDTAADLFMKGIIGAVKVYKEFFKMATTNVNGVIQKKSFKYVRNIDWTIINDIKLMKFYKYNRMKIYARSESIIDYTNKNYSSGDLYKISLQKILDY